LSFEIDFTLTPLQKADGNLRNRNVFNLEGVNSIRLDFTVNVMKNGVITA
jgi:hypothetical protein